MNIKKGILIGIAIIAALIIVFFLYCYIDKHTFSYEFY